MERVEADGRFGQHLAGDGAETGGQVHRHGLDPGPSGLAQSVVEVGQGLASFAFGDPYDPGPVVVGDDGQILVAASIGDLVHADAIQALQAAGI